MEKDGEEEKFWMNENLGDEILQITHVSDSFLLSKKYKGSPPTSKSFFGQKIDMISSCHSFGVLDGLSICLCDPIAKSTLTITFSPSSVRDFGVMRYACSIDLNETPRQQSWRSETTVRRDSDGPPTRC
jgi:hypothetical protein